MVFNRRNEWWIGCGMTFFVLGVIFSFTWTALFHAKIKDMMILKNGSTSFSIWREIPIPIYLECFLFNITNVDDILDGRNVSIHVQEFGPYVFRERSTKVNITWNDNSTVTFRNQRFWYFQPELSNGSLSDMITTINPIIATIAYTMRKDNLMLRFMVDMVLRMYHTNMFVTANASSWLFDGIRDPVLDLAGQIPNLPYTIPFDRFGWFYSRNGSIDFDGLFEINTGATDFSQLGNIQNWQNSNRTVYRDHCGDVKGSAGELWALNEKGHHPEINIFAADLCTSLSLAYSGPIVKKGLRGVEFSANDSLFDNGHHFPNMACYCSEVRDDECMPAGVFNVSACKYGAPAFVTKPHFLHMDPYYANKIEGLTPNEKHNFKMSIEPVTGMPLAVSAQLQANALVRHVPGIKINNQLPDPDVLIPMFWFREEIEVNDEYANFAKAALLVRYGFPYILYSFIVIGLSFIIYGAYRLRRFAMLKIQKTDIAASQKFLGNEKYKNEFVLSSTIYKK